MYLEFTETSNIYRGSGNERLNRLRKTGPISDDDGPMVQSF
jgi:hypothetical protein